MSKDISTVKIDMEVEIKLPSLPNFFSVFPSAKSGQAEKPASIQVSEFTEEQLREIGGYWTQALVDHAEKLSKL